MSGEVSIEKAELFFSIGEYSKAFDMAMDLLGQADVQEPYKLWTIAAKACLYLTCVLSRENREDFEKCAVEAFLSAQSAEEEIWVEYQLMNAIADWAPRTLEYAANIILRQPTSENRERVGGNFILASYKLYELACQTGFCVTLDSPADSPATRTRISKISKEERKELRMKICGVPECPTVDEDALRERALETAQLLFENLRRKINEYGHGSVEFVKGLLLRISQEEVCIECILRQIRPKEEYEAKNPTLARKIYQTELTFLRYVLDAKVYPNGKALSVMLTQEHRNSALNDWCAINKAMKRLNPDYDAGVVPSARLVNEYSNSNSGGCYVATAVYGSYDCPEVWTLRRFRDNTLASTWYGRAFIRAYYAISPTLVKWFGHTAWFKNMWRGKLDKMIDSLRKQGVESTPYQDRNW